MRHCRHGTSDTANALQQMREHNITVNAIAPGATKSGRWLEYTIKGNGGERSDFDSTEGGTLKRAAAVDEVARVVQFGLLFFRGGALSPRLSGLLLLSHF